jgi:hypothetical protein
MKHQPESKDNADRRIQIYVNASEFEAVYHDFQSSGYASLSAYLRRRLIGKGIVIHQPKELLARLDTIGTEIGHIGNNINQLAKIAHLIEKEGKLPVSPIAQFNKVMVSYNELLKELSSAYRRLLRNLS